MARVEKLILGDFLSSQPMTESIFSHLGWRNGLPYRIEKWLHSVTPPETPELSREKVSMCRKTGIGRNDELLGVRGRFFQLIYLVGITPEFRDKL